MALQVWLPLNGNLDNQGLSNITATVSGTTSYTNGKIGQGLNCNGSSYWTITPVTLSNNCSFCFWAKTSDTNAMFFVIEATVYAYLNFWLYNGKYYLNVGDSLKNPFQNNGTDIPGYADNIWHHYTIIFNGTQCLLYIDGEYKGKSKTYKNPTTTSTNKIKIAGGFQNAHSYDFNGVLNDFRIYNHCLSPKEVHEISQGLVLHYKLSNDITNKNLLPVSSQRNTENGSTSSNEYLNICSTLNIFDTYGLVPYTISFEIKAAVAHSFMIYGSYGTNPKYSFSSKTINVTTEWQRFSHTFTPYISKSDGTWAGISVYGTYGSGAIVSVRKVKLELGMTQTPMIGQEGIVYDCSGYKNHGILINGQISIESNTPRYNYCLKNTTEYICRTANSINFPQSSGLTISCWVNLTKWGSQTSGIWATSNSATSPSDYSTTACNHRDSGFDMRGTNGTTYRLTCNNTDIPLNNWKYVVMTHDGANAKLYINGSLIRTLALPSPLVAFNYIFLGYSLAGGAVRKCQGSWSDFRIYATALSENDIKELYDTPTFVDNQGDLLSGEFDDLANNMIELENYGIAKKQWLGGLWKFTQTNCQCTLEDDGYRIYRPANMNNASNGGSNNMYGGFILNNTNNIFGLVDGHTYIIEFDIKGQTSTAPSSPHWSFNFGNAVNVGLTPSPTNTVCNNPIIANFNSQEWHHFYYKWTINDGIYKVATATYSTQFIQGTTYLSYKQFVFCWGYINTGTLGTDLYIRNIRMYDITTNKEINIRKNGVTESINFIEEGNETQFFKTNSINSTQFQEI